MLITLDASNPKQDFPSIENALVEPDGLLAVGGCLSSERILNAYRQGIFPWYNADQPILWWSPNPRLVVFPHKLHISKRLRKTLRQQKFSIHFDSAFTHVINACAQPRQGETGTWLTTEMRDAYIRLHQQGHAHSVEAWQDGKLVGGLYGLALGHVFFGESMFHTQTDASKVAFVMLIKHLTHWGFQLIDCQVHSAHLESLGAETIPRHNFIKLLHYYCPQNPSPTAWQL